ncbi:C_GCAxxG_C_C family probable redox protein [Cetobacterium ceti]|uniref:C_GCAxxG_C_C family probable redox protein n=1 Tax=Cetobacterium ceti TaxID=180163 RepID=A0A1T4NF27_9FUSO|nr:C-GCAxxG-C-C family (seleno)protein [Cetobacterium ceti]SJZ77814.1 C_GCAxxG_C_C family probable redox protein [Cetobacterium ceti]
MEKKNLYIKGALNCAETIIDTYNKEHGTKIPVAIGSGMGSGVTCGSLCGAINAGVAIIGFTTGRESHLEENVARSLVNQYMKKCREKYNSEICIDLKNNKITCEEIVDFAYNELNKILKK